MIRFIVSLFAALAICLSLPGIAMAQDAPSPQSSYIQETTNPLGPLKDLSGTWVGDGWNMIAVPINNSKNLDNVGCQPIDLSGKEHFCLEVQPYHEVLTFTPIGGAVPNRGFPVDTFVEGLLYQQVVSDANTNDPIHIENGLWLLLDTEKQIVARLSSVPHGNAILATGPFTHLKSLSSVDKIGGLPDIERPIYFRGDYFDPYFHKVNAPTASFNPKTPFDPISPTKVLNDILAKQNVGETTVLDVSTKNRGGEIANIPFFETDTLKVPSFESTFLIENVTDEETGKPFLQLQYFQTTEMKFIEDFTSANSDDTLIMFPHIDVATMVKQ